MSDLGTFDLSDVGLFSSVDRASDPTLLVRFVDLANTMPDVRAAKDVVLEMLRPRTGDAVLDVGCGTGDDARELALRVGPAGRTVGVDASETMLGEARRRSRTTGVHVDFELADAQHLPFPDGTFDACRTERVLTHVPDPRAALAEMARVTRAGGRVCALDIDADPTDMQDPVTRALLTAMMRHVRNAWLGATLERLFAEVGMVGVEARRRRLSFDTQMFRPLISSELARLEAAGVLPEEEVRRWWAAWEQPEGAGAPLVPVTAVIVGGSPS